MNKLELPSPKNDFCQVLLKLTLWFWRRVFKPPHPIYILSESSLVWRGPGLSFANTWIPFFQGCCVSSFFEIGYWSWKRGLKCEQLTTTTTITATQTTDNVWLEKLTFAFRSDELKRSYFSSHLSILMYKKVFVPYSQIIVCLFCVTVHEKLYSTWSSMRVVNSKIKIKWKYPIFGPKHKIYENDDLQTSQLW